jgi:regulator of sigma E protease
MTFIIFIIVLGVLILVHELGHFLLAKKAGVKVEEFGFGYPPRALKLGRRWGTDFTLNWVPFGGFVKIFGENYVEEGKGDTNNEIQGKKFTEVSKLWQAAILVAGVFFNFLFAWLLLSTSFFIGVPAPVDNTFGGEVRDAKLTIVSVLPESPAAQANLKGGDKIMTAKSEKLTLDNPTPEEFSNFIEKSEDVNLTLDRGGEILNIDIIPAGGLIDEDLERKAIGISMDMVGTLKLPVGKSFIEGGKTAIDLTYLTAQGIGALIVNGVRGKADLSQVTGPVGIVGLVGDASRLGFAYLLTFTALISINLAVVNLLPIPALDGGRLVVVAIEAIKRSPVNAKFVNYVNLVGFSLLILLMVLITLRDISRLF